MAGSSKNTELTEVDGARSVTRALRILHEVSCRSHGASLSQVARSVDLPVTTTARLLKALEQAGFLVRDNSSQYLAGAKILQIGAIALSSRSLYDLAAPYLNRISEFTGETAYLAIPDGEGKAIYLRQVESPRAIRHATWTGKTIATDGTALGAALAYNVNLDGYASSRGTIVEPDAAAVAAPVQDGEGLILAALSMIGPSFRISSDDLTKFGEYVLSQAMKLSEDMLLFSSSG